MAPKTIKNRVLAFDHVEEISDERGSDDGIWVYYRNGFKSGSDPCGCLHQDHEDTWKEIENRVTDVMECKCEECKQEATNKQFRNDKGFGSCMPDQDMGEN